MPRVNIILVVVCVFLLGIILAGAQNFTPEGDRLYTPTRLEWLAVDFESRMGVELSDETRFMMHFIPLQHQDTIMIYVRYQPTVDREAMNILLEAARQVINKEAKARNWNSWLKVKEDITMAGTNNRPDR